ncbi:class I SAM-dependent methyltransferase, partial [Vibrio vulnificus]|uniref:class I SAM-dependent methyltransferase n=1 Tax=Vibrio vulnificus TaxID=672 RepID=UPI0024E035BF
QKLYDQFLPHLNPNGAILDAGCGSGRDAKHFKALGFKVTAFDANQALVELASRHLEQRVIHAKFDTFREKKKKKKEKKKKKKKKKRKKKKKVYKTEVLL